MIAFNPVGKQLQNTIQYLDMNIGITVVVNVRVSRFCGEVLFPLSNQIVMAMKSGGKATVSGGGKPW